MRVRTIQATLALVLLLFATACKSDQERSVESLEAFVQAVVIHRAPYRAYALLDQADKAHISVEEWATGFEERERVFPVGTVVTIGDVFIKTDKAEASVKITPPTGEPETRKYVLRRVGTKWRVWLGLELLESMRGTLAEARRLADDGAVDQAREKLETVAEHSFPASAPDAIDRELLLLRQKLGNKERFVELDGRFNAAMQADLEKMIEEVAALGEMVGPDDEAFFPRLQALRKEVSKIQRQAAIDDFRFEDVKARQTRDAWGLLREVRFKATNNTGRPLAKLAVRLDLKNEGSDTPLGTIVWQLVEEGGKLMPNATVNVKREVEKAPEDWKGRQVAVVVEDLQFADGEGDDAG